VAEETVNVPLSQDVEDMPSVSLVCELLPGVDAQALVNDPSHTTDANSPADACLATDKADVVACDDGSHVPLTRSPVCESFVVRSSTKSSSAPATGSISAKISRPSRNLISHNSIFSDDDPYVYPNSINRSKAAAPSVGREEFLNRNAKPGIRIGENYQAMVPSLSECKYPCEDSSRMDDGSASICSEVEAEELLLAYQHCVWKPDRIGSPAIRKYLSAANAIVESCKRNFTADHYVDVDNAIVSRAANTASLESDVAANSAESPQVTVAGAETELCGNNSVATVSMGGEQYRPVVNGALVIVKSETSSLVYDVLHAR
jgi:hypothetical protein